MIHTWRIVHIPVDSVGNVSSLIISWGDRPLSVRGDESTERDVSPFISSRVTDTVIRLSVLNL